jgi:hypothetical protein
MSLTVDAGLVIKLGCEHGRLNRLEVVNEVNFAVCCHAHIF